MDSESILLRPWNKLIIRECGESLQNIPAELNCVCPHPYQSIGAPYGEGINPWMLRTEVIKRLIEAQKALQEDNPQLRFLVFDAWRPIEVQAFMVDHEINKMCLLKGLDRFADSDALAVKDVITSVSKFWAYPNPSPQAPPPHSTGAAVDLTLADEKGCEISMGGEIDEIGPVSCPNFYSNFKEISCSEEGALWHQRRMILSKILNHFGFAQHPNEWWHFSFGDQLWAWSKGEDVAFYGNYPTDSIRSIMH